MKLIIFLSVFFALGHALGQVTTVQHIAFGYDGAGNRILRNGYKVTISDDPSMERVAAPVEALMQVYPNPTGGVVMLRLPSAEGYVEVSDLQGRLITRLPALSKELSYDLSGQPEGLYLFQHRREGEPVSTVKVILSKE